MPSLQQLRYLVALADTLHFRRAAESCHVAQPTLSAQLRAMEQRLGAELVERSRRRVILTPTGQEVARRARSVLREVEEIRAVAGAARRPFHGTLRVGAGRTLGPYLLPILIPELLALHDELRFAVREAVPARLLEMLEQGLLDLAVLPLPVRRAELACRPLFDEPLLAVLPRKHPLSVRPVLEAGDLAGSTVLTLDAGHLLHDQVDAICRAAGAEISAEYAGTSLDALRQMVAMDMGLSILPALYVRSEVERETSLVARAFAGPAPVRSMGLVWRAASARGGEFESLGEEIAAILRRRAPELRVLGP